MSVAFKEGVKVELVIVRHVNACLVRVADPIWAVTMQVHSVLARSRGYGE